MENIAQYEIEIDVDNSSDVDNEKNEIISKTEGKLQPLFSEIFDTISSFKKSVTVFQNQIKHLEKQVHRENKGLHKELSKLKVKKKQNKPSGFAKPVSISKELCEFLNKQEETKLARTEVTKSIIKYIKDNDLQAETEKKRIIPDQKLQKLLNSDPGEEITYFNIQKFMNKHFLK